MPGQPSTELPRTEIVSSCLGHRDGARDVALQSARMAEPLPAAERAADRAEAIMLLEAGMRIAPLTADHLAPARGGEHALARGGRELREIPREVARRADEAAGRRDSVLLEVAGDDESPAEQHPAGMPARERDAARERHVRRRLGQAGGVDDLALDPRRITLAGDGLDDQAEQRVAVIGVLEARAGIDDGRGFRSAMQLARVLRNGRRSTNCPASLPSRIRPALCDRSCAIVARATPGWSPGDEAARSVVEA